MGSVPRHCWWLPCSLDMLKHMSTQQVLIFLVPELEGSLAASLLSLRKSWGSS